MFDDVTAYSTATRLFLDLLDVYQRKGIVIPRKDQPLIRKCLIEFVKVVGAHYDGEKD